MSQSQKDKTPNIFYVTRFRHHDDILAKTRIRMTTAISFPAKMTLDHAQALLTIDPCSLPRFRI